MKISSKSKSRRPQPKHRKKRTRSRRTSDFTFDPKDVEYVARAVERRFKEIAVAAKIERELRKMFAGGNTSLQQGYYTAYTGNNHKVVDEYDDRHRMILPLRVDVQLRTLEKALDKVFFTPFPHCRADGTEGEGNVFSQEIIEFVRRKQAERRTLLRDAMNKFSERKAFDKLAHLFFRKMVGNRLRKVLSPDSRNEIRDKNVPIEILRPTPGFAAKVSLHLFTKCFGIAFDERTLTKRFARLQEQFPTKPSR